MRGHIKDFGFAKYQFFGSSGEIYFAPHYESDQFTSTELRLIADYMDAQAIEAQRAETGTGSVADESSVANGDLPKGT